MQVSNATETPNEAAVRFARLANDRLGQINQLSTGLKQAAIELSAANRSLGLQRGLVEMLLEIIAQLRQGK